MERYGYGVLVLLVNLAQTIVQADLVQFKQSPVELTGEVLVWVMVIQQPLRLMGHCGFGVLVLAVNLAQTILQADLVQFKQSPVETTGEA
jgi:hypothetical protein